MLNLLREPWIPIRTRSGARTLISPLGLLETGNPPVELASVRADFDGALAQFLIGLLQVAFPFDSESQWREWFLKPPSPHEVGEAFHALAPYFELDGAMPFMQDAALPSDADRRSIATLLLEAPGENTVENNGDLFVKRADDSLLAPELAAAALLCFQINAPSGGQGHRTSIRGGGPLSVLVWPDQIKGPNGAHEPATLWQKLWLNVLPTTTHGHDQTIAMVFPWTTATITSEGGRTVFDGWKCALSADEARVLAYFATPRRVRLQLEPANGRRCALSGASPDTVAVGFVSQNYGANYPSDKFRHPLSPYYRAKDGANLPMHINAAGFSYRDWVHMAGDDATAVPAVVQHVAVERSGVLADGPSLRAFGYAMDNMKVEAWHEARFPLFPTFSGDDRKRVTLIARIMIAGLTEAERSLGSALRDAWGRGNADSTQLAVRELRMQTESTFYDILRTQGQAQAADAEHHVQQLFRWTNALFAAAMARFLHHADVQPERQTRISSLERVAKAHDLLRKRLRAGIHKAMGIQRDAPTAMEVA